LKIGDFAPTGAVDPIFEVEGAAPTSHTSSQKTRKLCSFIWYINLDRSFYRFVTIYVCDRQTDRQTEFSSLDHVCIPCSGVKIKLEDSSYCMLTRNVDTVLSFSEKLISIAYVS